MPVELEGLDGVMRAYPVARGLRAQPRAVGRLVGKEAAAAIDGLREGVVLGLGNDEVRVGHGDACPGGPVGNSLFSGKLTGDRQVILLT